MAKKICITPRHFNLKSSVCISLNVLDGFDEDIKHGPDCLYVNTCQRMSVSSVTGGGCRPPGSTLSFGPS